MGAIQGAINQAIGAIGTSAAITSTVLSNKSSEDLESVKKRADIAKQKYEQKINTEGAKDAKHPGGSPLATNETVAELRNNKAASKEMIAKFQAEANLRNLYEAKISQLGDLRTRLDQVRGYTLAQLEGTRQGIKEGKRITSASSIEELTGGKK